MPRLNNDEQFKFLISCIRYSNNGKVDFSEVAKECSIVSKGAAAKRYERMMKAHGIHQPSHAVGRDTAVPPMRAKVNSALTDAASKKRKIDEFDNANVGPDNHEISPKKVKNERTDHAEDVPIKKEEPMDHYPWFYTRTSSMDNQLEQPAFSDFLASSAFQTANTQERQINHHTDNEVQRKIEEHSILSIEEEDATID